MRVARKIELTAEEHTRWSVGSRGRGEDADSGLGSHAERLPHSPGDCGAQTPGYKRYDATALLAVLDLAEGVIGVCQQKHRPHERSKFLKRIDQQIDAALGLHLIVDNYAAHQRPKLKPWLKRRPRFDAHFIPTSSAWLNIFERRFREHVDKRIRRGAFRSVPQLVEALEASVQQHAPSATPSIWIAQADESLAKVSRAVLNKAPSV